jgi:hypothetical protein
MVQSRCRTQRAIILAIVVVWQTVLSQQGVVDTVFYGWWLYWDPEVLQSLVIQIINLPWVVGVLEPLTLWVQCIETRVQKQGLVSY